jgi:hypothetical protein
MYCLVANSSFGKAGEQEAAWKNDCSTLEGWSSNLEDKSFQARVEQSEPSVIKVAQDGKDGWGKAAILVKHIDLDSAARLEVKVNKVDKDSAYQIAVASTDWSEFFVVVPRSSADGIKTADIKSATGWSGTRDFNVVVIVEGKNKASYFDELKIVGGK